ncbi:MAG: hypothetical protein AUG44_08770 [Actinobacteria bacterium 13_1_20CM_3_71_11]|nr:MAG: hypothetical protein AUG44_08770 [Actinobacteria bacterium 13_1_20CM_3_71_11]
MPKFTLDGETYEYDGKLTVKDARFLWEKAGIGIGRLNVALIVEGQPDVIAAFMYLLKRRNGEAIKWGDVDDWDLSTFMPVTDDPKQLRIDRQRLMDRVDYIDEQLAATDDDTEAPNVVEEPEAAPDPTRNGKTRRRATTNT